ncbi:MAG: acyl-protein synthetase [Myxococcales bacterium]|nr:acyl-protein synthetase [Myxococcales bacterium]
MITARDVLRRDVHALIERLADGSRDDRARDALLTSLAEIQAATVPAYARLIAARGRDPYPAMPTDVFRFARVAWHPAADDVRVFRTSGTTHGERGAHPFRDLETYDRAAEAAARHALFPDVARIDMAIVAPDEREAPDSSLAYMLARFGEWFASNVVQVWHSGGVDIDRALRALRAAESTGKPLAIVGTTLALLHLDEALEDTRFRLPARSRIMQTGGFKTPTGPIPSEDVRTRLAARFGIPDAGIIAEYGMTELSSQLYERTLIDRMRGRITQRRTYWYPGWVRVTAVDPESLRPLPEGETGLLRFDDVANVDSVVAVQTADVGRVEGEYVELLGRAPGAVQRGCSLAAADALGRQGTERP